MSDSIGTRVTASVLALALGGVGWLGWVESGSVVRNSYEMFRAAQRLGLDVLTPLRVVWFLVPVASLLVVVLMAAGFVRSGLGVLVLEALLVGAAGVAVLVVGVRGGIGSLVGVALAGAVVALIISDVIRRVRLRRSNDGEVGHPAGG